MKGTDIPIITIATPGGVHTIRYGSMNWLLGAESGGATASLSWSGPPVERPLPRIGTRVTIAFRVDGKKKPLAVTGIIARVDEDARPSGLPGINPPDERGRSYRIDLEGVQ